MLLKKALEPFHLILASQSPRRQDILTQMGLVFETRVRSVEEDYPDHLQGKEIPIFLAELKASAFEGDLQVQDILITSDTIVWYDGEALGKPKDVNDAKHLLRKLSGTMHEVFTAVCLKTTTQISTVVDVTKVYFNPISDQHIEQYIHECKPFDKAGAYGVQDWMGLVAVNRIEGSFYNVMGFPSHLVHKELEKIAATLNPKQQFYEV